ncbi:MAG: DUF2520 domain-containing protein [Bacteroidales bacterium]
METKSIDNIIIIGAGNVATHLSKAFLKANKKILQVISKTTESAKELASICNCSYTNNLQDIKAGADLYLIAASDKAIKEIASAFPHKGSLTVHTSGSMPMELLKSTGSNYGIFYPLQTFTKDIPLNYDNIPFCLEASSEEKLEKLKKLAGEISNNLYEINYEQRQMLHVAAVFACNFTNHMYSIANNILQKDKLSFEILRPLIEETAKKVKSSYPNEVQTGPAVRNDKETIDKHMEKLNMFEDYQKIYTFITESIQKEIDSKKRDNN